MARPKDVWRRWKKESTLSGIARVDSGRDTEDIVWAVVITVAVCVVVVQMGMMIKRYSEYEVKTTKQYTTGEIAFPAVTVCNLNPYKASEIIKLQEFADLIDYLTFSKDSTKIENDRPVKNGSLDELQYTTMEAPSSLYVVVSSFCNCQDDGTASVCVLDQEKVSSNPHACACVLKDTWMCTICPTNETCHYKYVAVMEQKVQTYGFSVNESKIANQVRAAEGIPFVARMVEEEEYRLMTYHFNETVWDCMFGSTVCDESDFIEQSRTSYGRCYSFNREKVSRFNISRRGPDYGLRLILYSNSSDYISLTESEGIRITLHQQDTYPFAATYGYDAPAGSLSTFSIRGFRTTKLDVGENECMHAYGRHFTYPGKYTVEGCQRECVQNISFLKCGCGDARFPLTNENQTYCKVDDVEQRQCLSSIADRSEFSCDCPSPCVETTYTPIISHASLHPSNIVPFLRVANSTVSNLAIVHVYFEDIVIEHILEEAAYTFATFLSDIGATMGFWMGMSVVTLLEMFIFGTDLLRAVVDTTVMLSTHLRYRHLSQTPIFIIRSAQFIDPRIVPVNRDWDPYRMCYRSEIDNQQREHRQTNYRHLRRVLGVRIQRRHRMPNTRLPL